MSSSVDPLKLLNRGPAYLRNALQQTQQNNKTRSAAERLNVRKKSTEVILIKSENFNNLKVCVYYTFFMNETA